MNLNSILYFILIVVCFSGINGYAQETKTISGTVSDINNETIIGASVSINFSGNMFGGTVTDVNGNFRLSAPVGSTLNVSYIGFKPYQETVTAGKDVYPVTLQEDVQSLDEVVVVGYGTQKRSELTGSISSVQADNIKDFSSKAWLNP